MEQDTLIRAFGLNWKRDDTGWNVPGATGKQMIGWLKGDPSVTADLWAQWGIYVLRSGPHVTYVGIASMLGRRIRQHWADHHADWDSFSWFGSCEVVVDSRTRVGRLVLPQSTRTDSGLHAVQFGRVWLDIEAMLHRAFLPNGTHFGERGRVPYFGRRPTEWVQATADERKSLMSSPRLETHGQPRRTRRATNETGDLDEVEPAMVQLLAHGEINAPPDR